MSHHNTSWITKGRFYGSVGLLYIATIGGIWYITQASNIPTAPTVAATTITTKKEVPKKPTFVLVSGKPIRVVIPNSGIDLPVTDGYYNEADGSWTLSDDHAQFAMLSFLANNLSGSTFIYGHGTDAVFGRLNTAPPAVGELAVIYTDNGHVFNYMFESMRNLTPNDTSVLAYTGPSILTIQTCSGSFSEWRSMFQFRFVGVAS